MRDSSITWGLPGTSDTKNRMLQSGEIKRRGVQYGPGPRCLPPRFCESRRSGDAVAAAIPAVHGAPAIQKVRAANDQVQFGMIGTGSRGSYLLKHLKSIDNGRCVAACDINPENLKHGIDTIGNNPKQFKDYRELLADEGRGRGIRHHAAVRSLPDDEGRLDGGQARFLREVPGVQAGGSARAARAVRRSIPSRSCRPGCSAVTATSTRP